MVSDVVGSSTVLVMMGTALLSWWKALLFRPFFIGQKRSRSRASDHDRGGERQFVKEVASEKKKVVASLSSLLRLK